MTQQELNYNASAQQRAEVYKEINANKVNISRAIFAKSKEEKQEVKKEQNRFNKDGLVEWNERNRPGNNKK